MLRTEPFTGFSEETGIFLRELAIHNYRSWFEEHRGTFENALKKPMESLAHDTAELLMERFPEEPFSVHISRIYRDARRLFGRGPYKENMWFVIKPFDDRQDGASFYFEIQPLSWSTGFGYWGESPAMMASLRHYIDAHEQEFIRFQAAVDAQDFYKTGGELYARSKGHVNDALYRFYNSKSLWIGHEEPHGEVLYNDALPMLLADHFAEFMPFYRELVKASVTQSGTGR